MISFVHSPPCGNAIALTVYAAGGLDAWRLLRRADTAFVGADDPDAAVIAEGADLDGFYPVFDYTGLVNGQTYGYQHYILVDGVWTASGDPVTAVPAYVAEPLFGSPDFAGLLRERLALGLAAEVAAGRLRHASGAIPVLAANPLIESVQMPLVTVILTERRAEVRGIGEILMPDQGDADWVTSSEGWLDRSVLQIVVWATNHDDRLRLRDAVQRVLMLNLPVFDAAGYYTPDISEADSADFDTYSAPAYQSVFTFSCLHAALVRMQTPAIKLSESQVNVTTPYE